MGLRLRYLQGASSTSEKRQRIQGFVVWLNMKGTHRDGVDTSWPQHWGRSVHSQRAFSQNIGIHAESKYIYPTTVILVGETEYWMTDCISSLNYIYSLTHSVTRLTHLTYTHPMNISLVWSQFLNHNEWDIEIGTIRSILMRRIQGCKQIANISSRSKVIVI